MNDSIINLVEYTPHSHLPYGEDGSGHYSKAVRIAFDVIKAAKPLTLEAIDKVLFQPSDGAFVICDYGTADGGTSMSLVRDIIDKLQDKYGAAQQVHVIYEDQPMNDFKSLFLRIQGFIPDPTSYLIDHKNVFVSCNGTSFYFQCLPDNSVHLGFSSTAVHWLSKRPCNLSGGYILYANSNNEEDKRLFAQQASRDWEMFLLHRAKELKPGGQLIIVGVAIDEKGQFSGKATNLPHNTFEHMEYHWRTMLQDDLITQEEFDMASYNFYFRTKAEYSAPFMDRQSAECRAGLELVSVEIKIIQNSLRWLHQSNSGDGLSPQEFAHSFIATLRPWSNHSFFSALSEDKPEQERSALIDEFFHRYENEVAKNPKEYAHDYVAAYIHIAKRN